MRIFDSLINSLIYTAYVIGACICGVAVDFLTLKILNEFLVISLFGQTIIRTVIYCIVPFVVLAIVSYKEGFREARFSALESVISCGISFVGAFFISVLFNFNRLASGGVKYISSLIAYGDRLSREDAINNVPYRYALPVFVILFVLYSATIILFKLIGKERRLVSREKLIKEKAELEEK